MKNVDISVANFAKAMQDTYLFTCKPGTISADSFTCSCSLQIMLPTEEPAKLTKGEPAAIIGKPGKKKKERDSSHSFKSLDASVFQLT